ncbi:hemin-degrading factor [Rubrivirga sp.]|uniref:hemin-degrading factor n=1 Tax=Rubrivirga sp. TaxID=1885344 RepID=UPI003C76DB6D
MSDLRTTFAAFRAENPKTRIRTAARELGVSEAELVTTGVDGDVIPLGKPDGGWRALIHDIEPLGEVMALTRNDACVHEKHGVYDKVSTDLPHQMALVLDEPIDLRLFCGRWASAFAVATPMGDGQRRSLQFFDAHGDAVHKIFLTGKSDADAYHAFVDAHRADDLVPSAGSGQALEVEPRATREPDTPDSDLEVDAFLQGWADLQDTHDFFPLLRNHGVGRTQALRLAEGRFTERAEPVAARRALEAAAQTGTPIMVFVGNPGAIQIHSGPVERLLERGPWFNVLDPTFNLHLDETQISEAWVVVKPTEDGDVTALEVYDDQGRQIVQLFGARKPGIPELTAWREIVAELPRAGVPA